MQLTKQALDKQEEEDKKEQNNRYVKFCREMRLNADKLFGANFDVTIFKDNHGAKAIVKPEDIDIEHELIGQDHLDFQQRQAFIDNLYKK